MAATASNPVPLAFAKAVAALGDAEVCLRQSAAEAAEAGNYDALEVLTRWAKAIQALVADVVETPGRAGSKTDRPVQRERAPRSGRTGPTNGVRVASSGPTYSRDSDTLVKTARSRKSRNNYEHRATADVVFTVAECVSVWRPNQTLLTGDQLLDSYTKKKGSVISYQVYAALGWFTQLGLVRRHGRSGYSVPQPHTVVSDVQKAWDSLKDKRGR